MSQNIIKLTPDSEGRAYLHLYGKKIEVTDIADEKGKGEAEAFGEIYRFQIVRGKAEKSATKEKDEVEITKVNKDGTAEAIVNGKKATVSPANEDAKEVLEDIKREEGGEDEN